MSAQILPLQAALDARRAKARRRCDEFKRLVKLLDPSKQQYLMEMMDDTIARNREKTAGRKNVVDLDARPAAPSPAR